MTLRLVWLRVVAASLLAGAVPSCRPDPERITVEVLVEEEAFRPDHVLVWWATPDGRERKDIRLPESGALEPEGRVLATLSVEMRGGLAGERNVIAWGMRGSERVSGAMARVAWMPGERRQISLTLGCLQELAAKGVLPPDAPGSPPRTACPGARAGQPDAAASDAGEPAPDALGGPLVDFMVSNAGADGPSAGPDGPPAALDGPPAGPDDAQVRADRANAGDGMLSDREPLPPGADLGRGLVLYLRFDDAGRGVVTRDWSGNQNVATLRNLDFGTNRVQGASGGAIDLGGRGWVAVEASKSVNSITEGFSLSAFLNRNGDGTVVARRAVGPGGFLYRLQIAGGKLNGVINSANGARADLTSSITVPSREWLHVAMVYDRVSLRLYLAGNNVGQQRYELTLGPENSPLLIGASQNTTAEGATDILASQLDEVVVYNRPLSDAEVRALAAGHQPPAR